MTLIAARDGPSRRLGSSILPQKVRRVKPECDPVGIFNRTSNLPNREKHRNAGSRSAPFFCTPFQKRQDLQSCTDFHPIPPLIARQPRIGTAVICPPWPAHANSGNMFKKSSQNTYTIHLCEQGKEFRRILDFAGLFRPIVGAVIEGRWRILAVTSGPHEAFVDVEEVNTTSEHADRNHTDCG
jgi:hypothetical protein